MIYAIIGLSLVVIALGVVTYFQDVAIKNLLKGKEEQDAIIDNYRNKNRRLVLGYKLPEEHANIL